jgi:hypothetical protein
MNDRGKTVDCLWPRPQEIDSDYEVVLEGNEAVLAPKGELGPEHTRLETT